MIGLVRLLAEHSRAVEADLQEHYHLALTDPTLTVRRLWVLLTQLPPTARTVRAVTGQTGPPWTVEAHLLDDLRLAMAGGQPHPARPRPGRRQPDSPQRQARLADARRRAAARRAAAQTEVAS